MSFYTVLYDNTATISDISQSLKDFTFNFEPVAMADTHYLYVGYYKPFKQFYVELGTSNTVDGSFSFEYWNGSTWTSLEVVDETLHFKNSGFVYFDRPEGWAANTVNSIEKFYIRMQPSASHDAGTVINGLGILFSNDKDLEGIKSNIVSKLNGGDSWIGKHESARKYIIQRLRNLGYRKYNTDNVDNPLFLSDGNVKGVVFSNLTEFDLIEPFELREASKFYTLSMIYLDELSDEQDDKWERAGQRHLQRAEEAINLFMLRIDEDDDGIEDDIENYGDTGTNLSWL